MEQDSFHTDSNLPASNQSNKTNNSNTQSPQRKIPRRNQNSQDDTEMKSATEPGSATTRPNRLP